MKGLFTLANVKALSMTAKVSLDTR